MQVNGKLRGRVSVSVSADEATIREAAIADEHVRKFVGDKPIRKRIACSSSGKPSSRKYSSNVMRPGRKLSRAAPIPRGAAVTAGTPRRAQAAKVARRALSPKKSRPST